jgi:hypothetical protein
VVDFETAVECDATIVGIEVLADSVKVILRDWRERQLLLVFSDVLAFQAISPLNEDLDCGLVEKDDELLIQAGSAIKEVDVQAYRTFSFISAWTGVKILKIVAKGVDRFEQQGSR